MRILPLAEAKAKLSQLVASVAATDEEVTITRNGRATAVLVSYEEFESWKETLAIVADPEFLAEIRKGIAELKQGRGKLFRDRDLNRSTQHWYTAALLESPAPPDHELTLLENPPFPPLTKGGSAKRGGISV